MAISAEGTIGIGLTLVFALGAGAYMRFPDQQWIGTATMIVAAAGLVLLIIHHVWSWSTVESFPMSVTPADIGFNSAIAAAIISIVAALRRAPKVAIAAAALAWIGIGIDYALGPKRGWIWSSPQIIGHSTEGPISWLLLAPRIDPEDSDSNYSMLQAVGFNESNHEITLNDAHFISEITGEIVELQIQPWSPVQIKDVNPIPPGATFTLFYKFANSEGLPLKGLLTSWGPIGLVVKYDGKEYRVNFPRDELEKITDRKVAPYPHVTVKNPAAN